MDSEIWMPRREISQGAGLWPPGTGAQAWRAELHLHHQHDPARERIESCIRQRYRQRYGAHVRDWLPTLVSLQADGEILAIAGYRGACAPLFLERYLSAPVERYIDDAAAPVERRRIVEVGHFAAMHPGAGRRLVPLLAQHLHRQGYEWVVSTLTAELHHLFSRMGLAHRSLAQASASHLDPQERAEWGSYYAHDPQVFAGHLGTILARFGGRGA